MQQRHLSLGGVLQVINDRPVHTILFRASKLKRENGTDEFCGYLLWKSEQMQAGQGKKFFWSYPQNGCFLSGLRFIGLRGL
jgi:hypothetical protein